jgi:hypothetical protein
MRVEVFVESDPGRPVAGATVRLGDTGLATGPDGLATVTLEGRDGAAFAVDVTCPAGFKSPKEPLALTLRRFADPKTVPRYTVSCRPEVRTLVVAVRTDGAAGLPVRYLDQEVARTDASGAAHLVVRAAPNEAVTVEIGTDEKGAERLVPQNPRRTFWVKDSDDVVLFDQRFELTRTKRVPVAVDRGPERIVSRGRSSHAASSGHGKRR